VVVLSRGYRLAPGETVELVDGEWRLVRSSILTRARPSG
jgi:hypothetical protein